jgi:hypothetical protein
MAVSVISSAVPERTAAGAKADDERERGSARQILGLAAAAIGAHVELVASGDRPDRDGMWRAVGIRRCKHGYGLGRYEAS